MTQHRTFRDPISHLRFQIQFQFTGTYLNWDCKLCSEQVEVVKLKCTASVVSSCVSCMT